jgi:hypothetical protein
MAYVKTTPPTVDVPTAARLLDISRGYAYERAKTGQLAEGIPVITVGSVLRVPTAPLEAALGRDLADLLADDEPPAA